MTVSGTAASQAVLNTEGLNGGLIAAADTFYVIKDGTYYELVSHNKDLTEERQILYVPEEPPAPVPTETPVPTVIPTPAYTPVPTDTPAPQPPEEVKPASSVIPTGDRNRKGLWMTGLLAGASVLTVLAVRRKQSRSDRPAGS